MNAVDARKYLAATLDDSIDLVRARIARAYTRIVLPENVETLDELLEDRSQLVRYQIGLGLRDRGMSDSLAQSYVIDRLLETTKSGRYTYGVLLPLARDIVDQGARRQLFDGLSSSGNERIRADALDLVLSWDDRALLQRAVERKRNEQSSLILYRIYAAEDRLR